MATEREQAHAQQPVFTIEKIYVKDLSLEVPNSPQVFLERETPKVDIQLGTRALPLDDGHYEVVLTVTTTASFGPLLRFGLSGFSRGRSGPRSTKHVASTAFRRVSRCGITSAAV